MITWNNVRFREISSQSITAATTIKHHSNFDVTAMASCYPKKKMADELNAVSEKIKEEFGLLNLVTEYKENPGRTLRLIVESSDALPLNFPQVLQKFLSDLNVPQKTVRKITAKENKKRKTSALEDNKKNKKTKKQQTEIAELPESEWSQISLHTSLEVEEEKRTVVAIHLIPNIQTARRYLLENLRNLESNEFGIFVQICDKHILVISSNLHQSFSGNMLLKFIDHILPQIVANLNEEASQLADSWTSEWEMLSSQLKIVPVERNQSPSIVPDEVLPTRLVMPQVCNSKKDVARITLGKGYYFWNEKGEKISFGPKNSTASNDVSRNETPEPKSVIDLTQ